MQLAISPVRYRRAMQYIDGSGSAGMVGLAVEAPDAEVRGVCLGVCVAGDVLPLDSPGRDRSVIVSVTLV